MADPDIDRVKADLERLNETLGLGANIDDARGHALVAASGALTLAWTMLAPPHWHFLGLLSVLLPMAYLVKLRVTHRSSVGGSPAMRRQFADALWILTLGVPIMAYSVWAQYLGVPPLLVLATVVFFVGVMMLGGAPQQPTLASWSVAMMAGALAIPLKLVSPVAAIAVVLVLGGLFAGFIARRQVSAAR